MACIHQPGKGARDVVLPGFHALGQLALAGRIAFADQGIQQRGRARRHGRQLRTVIVRQPIQNGVEVVPGGHHVLGIENRIGQQCRNARVAAGEATVGINPGQLLRAGQPALKTGPQRQVLTMGAFTPGRQGMVLKLPKQALAVVLVKRALHSGGQQHDARLMQQPDAQQ